MAESSNPDETLQHNARRPDPDSSNETLQQDKGRPDPDHPGETLQHGMGRSDPELTVKSPRVPEYVGPAASAEVTMQGMARTRPASDPRKRRSGKRRRPAKRQASKRPNRFQAYMRYVARKLNLSRLPGVGPTGTVFGLVGLGFGTLAISLVLAITLRAFIDADAFNPFRDTVAVVQGTPFATPNPTFLAPTIDVGTDRSWNGDERVTVLVMGIDARPGEEGIRTRTDTMILMMLDPQTNHASMLSIPRDLYVDIPGRGLNRVNTAYVYGGGPMAIDTIEYNLGVPVNYYVTVDFNVFITLVDEIGGIDIWVPKTINDPSYPDSYYGYDPFYIEAGQQHLDGRTALKYARTRHADNDYERARRQQAVIMAIRQKVLSVDMLPTLVTRAPALYANLSASVRTDMTLDDLIALAMLAQDVPEENIRSGVIDSQYIVGYYTPEGASVSIPRRDKVAELLRYVFWLEE